MKFIIISLLAAFSPATFGQIILGTNATVVGTEGIAIGNYAESASLGISLGNAAAAMGSNSIAVGTNAQSLEDYATAFGAGIAEGFGSFAVGYYNEDNNQQGRAATESMSFHGNALGVRSISLGVYSYATNFLSIAIGYNTMSSGQNSIAIGGESDAVGNFSAALGAYTLAAAPRSSAVGAWNKPLKKGTSIAPDPVIATPADPIFNVGNGAGGVRQNALTVYRDGDAHFAGAVRVKASGDIGMGSFTSGIGYQP